MAISTRMSDARVIRAMERARELLEGDWPRVMEALSEEGSPIRRVAQRELRKTRKLEGVIPFYPAVPLIPIAVMAGLAVFSTILAVRSSRCDRELAARLDAIEGDLAMERQSSEREASVPTGASQPAHLPWS